LYCFASVSQVIGCEDRLWSDLDCVWWGVKLHSYISIRGIGGSVICLVLSDSAECCCTRRLLTYVYSIWISW